MADYWIVVAPFGDYAVGQTITDAAVVEQAPQGSTVRVLAPAEDETVDEKGA